MDQPTTTTPASSADAGQRPALLIVVPSTPLRGAIGQCVRALQPGWQCLDAATGEEAIGIAQARVPQLVLLDAQLPGLSAELTAHALAALEPAPRLYLLAEPWQMQQRPVLPAPPFSGQLCKDRLYEELGDLLVRARQRSSAVPRS